MGEHDRQDQEEQSWPLTFVLLSDVLLHSFRPSEQESTVRFQHSKRHWLPCREFRAYASQEGVRGQEGVREKEATRSTKNEYESEEGCEHANEGFLGEEEGSNREVAR